jgi:hypothetical protein
MVNTAWRRYGAVNAAGPAAVTAEHDERAFETRDRISSAWDIRSRGSRTCSSKLAVAVAASAGEGPWLERPNGVMTRSDVGPQCDATHS